MASHLRLPAASGAKRTSPQPSNLTGIAAVQRAFHFLDGPADVLRASATNRRWHDLACADSVWRPKAKREGILKKAGAFEVAVPSVTGAGTSGASSSSSSSASSSCSSGTAAVDEGGGGGGGEDEDEAAGVWLAFYAQVFVLQGYKMKDQYVDPFKIWWGDEVVPEDGIRTAVWTWSTDPAAAKARYGPIASWDTSEITSMEQLFMRKADFNADLSGWDVSNVTNMNRMFNGATSFNADLSGWDVSSVTDMGGMFNGATSFNADLSGWDVSSVTDMNNMFDGATSFNADLSGWDVSSVTNMDCMFCDATSFNADLSSWDVSSVKTMRSMFRGATSFTRQLTGTWSNSLATKNQMFSDNCPGSIMGLTNSEYGTPGPVQAYQAAAQWQGW
eukprot:CAMPEP_0205909030 /NCGR_PEP_ID=MMETSP1325-20131115/3597_1 /ASSEMBLY_ACC=CAM_ASM_000708 /TAXON_ID=236786 /ORGANISM="Florenciella sp., Strain RCC1007" /LENGTH=388 /DNA_ID=CAMNT_0053275291 /DNA_START=23 /DNA_END=1189 /DNA_ORIENTATION=+